MLYSSQDEFPNPVSKFEAMIKTNEVFFFDAQEFESIVQYYIDYGKINLAERAIEIGINQHPKNGELLLLKSEILIFEGDYKKSLEIIELVEKLIPQNEDVFLQKASIASKSKQHFEAVGFLNEALELSEEPEEIWALLGMEFLILEDFNSAKYYFKLCLNDNLLDYQSLYNLLYAYDQLNDSNGAIETLNSILERDPYCEVAWHQLGKIYCNQNNYKEAISAFEFAIISDDKFTGAYIEIGKIFEKIGKINLAIENYHIASQINDPSAYVFYRIANCYSVLGNSDLSIQFYKKSVNIEPTFEKSWIGIIDYYLKNDDLDSTLLNAKQALDSNEGNAVITKKVGDVFFKLNKFEEAIFYYESIIELAEYDLCSWTSLIDCLIKQYMLNQAKKRINQALDIYLNSPDLILRLAIIELKLGKNNSAKKFLGLIDKNTVNKFFENDLYSSFKDKI